MNEQLPCLVCDKALPADPTARCLTDCSHEFCLACLCRVLTTLKNRCPGCHVQVKQVTQLQPQSPATPPPATVRFCNAIYTLNVSIWAVKDPAKTLASLFHLYVVLHQDVRDTHLPCIDPESTRDSFTRAKCLRRATFGPGQSCNSLGVEKGHYRLPPWGIT